jgi:predicted transposase/invertase (TIGR01784 family)
MGESLFEEQDQFHHDFRILEKSNFRNLSEHFNLHVIEMQKWTSSLKGDSLLDSWLKFLNYGEDLDSDTLPEDLQIPVIQKAMSTLTRFTQSDEEHDLYMRRLEYLSLENTWKSAREQAESRAVKAEAEKEQVVAENDKLRQALLDAGIDPDELK